MDEMKLFFDPSSIALIGSTDREGAPGRIVLENLLTARETRKIYPVNPEREQVFDLKCYPNINSLPEVPQLAVIITPAPTVNAIVEECGKVGVKAIIIISTGFKEIGGEGIARHEKLSELIATYHLKLLGPGSMGVIRPSTNLNTTLFRKMPKPGYIAFISQSGALGAGILDWAIKKNIGFSAFVSPGSMAGIDFAEAIDYFGQDSATRSIIIYPESIGNAKSFMSATRGFARSKPIIVLKPGKSPESKIVTRTHTGAMIGEDLYYDAIFRRAGVVRVEETKDFFLCAEIMNSARLPRGSNLAIITNGGGPAAIAVDNLISRGGSLAKLSDDTLRSMNELLPPNWSRINPVDIREDADVKRYVDAIKVTIQDAGVDGLLVMYAPQGGINSTELAHAILELTRDCEKPVFTVMLGGDDVEEARQLFDQNHLPAFEYPEDAIRAYFYMCQYARNLDMIYETPEESPLAGAPKNHVKALIHRAIEKGSVVLSAEDTAKLLSSYRISSPPQHFAAKAKDAVNVASVLGYPVAVKVRSPQILHKTDVKGIILNVASDDDLVKAFNRVIEEARQNSPEADIEGVIVQKMVSDIDYELIIGCKKDPICGPIIMFGQGGIEAEFFKDIAVGLPPLNQTLARRIIEQTKIYRILREGFRAKAPVDLRLLDDVLVKVSNLIVDFPEISEIDINPLVVSGGTVLALDSRIVLDEKVVKDEAQEFNHLIISPYPTRYIQPWRCKDGRFILLRPVKPEDEAMEKALLESIPENAMRYRFFYILKEITHDMLTRFCNIDYEREMAIIAEYTADNVHRNVGTGRLIIHGGNDSGEFALLVASDFENNGLGLKLLDILIGVAREKRLKSIYGIVLNENTRMLALARRLGFTVQKLSTSDSIVVLDL